MQDNQNHGLAIIYAESKFKEYLIEKRDAPLCIDTNFSKEEVSYLKSAYDFAIKNLSE